MCPHNCTHCKFYAENAAHLLLYIYCSWSWGCRPPWNQPLPYHYQHTIFRPHHILIIILQTTWMMISSALPLAGRAYLRRGLMSASVVFIAIVIVIIIAVVVICQILLQMPASTLDLFYTWHNDRRHSGPQCFHLLWEFHFLMNFFKLWI